MYKGIGGGRIPFDVNTALMPAALRSIAALARNRVFAERDWATLADKYAQIWEDETLKFFQVWNSKSSHLVFHTDHA